MAWFVPPLVYPVARWATFSSIAKKPVAVIPAGSKMFEIRQLAQTRRRRARVPRPEDVAEAGAMLEELADGDAVGDRRRIVGQMLAHQVVERELAGRGELLDRLFREDLVDRADVEARAGAVLLRLVRLSPGPLEQRLAVLRDQEHAGEVIALRELLRDGADGAYGSGGV